MTPLEYPHHIITGHSYRVEKSERNDLSASVPALSPYTNIPNLYRQLNEQDEKSHLSAAGHAGLLRFQRDKALTKATESETSATRLRNLSLRLAAKVVTCDIKAQKQNERLEKAQLNNYLLDRRNTNAASSFQNALNIYQQRESEIISTIQSLDENPQHQPTLESPQDVLELCKSRVEGLVRECIQFKKSLQRSKEVESKLHDEIRDKEEVVHSLDVKLRNAESEISQYVNVEANLKSSLDESNNKMVKMHQELASLQKSSEEWIITKANLELSLDETKTSRLEILNRLEDVSNRNQMSNKKIKELESQIEEEENLRCKLLSMERRHNLALCVKEDEVGKLQESLNHLHLQVSELLAKEHQASRLVKTLESQLHDERVKTANLMRTQSTLENQVLEYQGFIKTLKQKVSDLQLTIENQNESIKFDQEEQIKAYRKSMQEIEATHQTRMIAIINSNDTLRKELKLAQEEVMKYKSELEHVKMNLSKSFSIEHVTDLQNEIQKLVAQLKGRDEKLGQNEIELQALQNIKYDSIVKQDQIFELENQIQLSQKSRSNLSSELQKLQSLHEDEINNSKKMYESDKERLQLELERMQNLYNELESQMALSRLKEKQIHSQSSSTQSSSTQTSATSTKSGTVESGTQVDLLRSHLEMLDAHEKQIASLRDQLLQDKHQYDLSLSELQAQNARLEKLLTSNQQATQMFHNRFRKLQHEDSQKRKRMSDLEMQLQSKDNELAELRDMKYDLLERINTPPPINNRIRMTSISSRHSMGALLEEDQQQHDSPGSEILPSIESPSPRIKRLSSIRSTSSTQSPSDSLVSKKFNQLRHRSETPDLKAAFRDSTASASSNVSGSSGAGTMVDSCYSSGEEEFFNPKFSTSKGQSVYAEGDEKVKNKHQVFKGLRKLLSRPRLLVG